MDAGKWNGGGKNINMVEVNRVGGGGGEQATINRGLPRNSKACTISCIVTTYPGDPLTEDSIDQIQNKLPKLLIDWDKQTKE